MENLSGLRAGLIRATPWGVPPGGGFHCTVKKKSCQILIFGVFELETAMQD